MSKLRKYLKIEVDVEFFACVHGVSTVFIYGFCQWIGGVEDVPFTFIVQQLLLGYVIAWVQKGLFLKEKAYTKREYRLREVCWCIIPVALMVLTGSVFRWFQTDSVGIVIAFYLCMACYFLMLWLFLKYLYQEESREMNHLLNQWKKEAGKK